MHRHFTLVLILLLMVFAAPAQDHYYIQLTDKKNNQYSIDHPEAYLSPRSIARRQEQHIAIQENDLPLTTSYVAAVSALSDQVVYMLKWDNAMLLLPAEYRSCPL
jgi:serine protease AprX